MAFASRIDSIRRSGGLALCALALVALCPAGAEAAAPEAELLVKFESDASRSERSAVHRRVGADVEARLAPQGVDVVELDEDQTVAQALAAYLRNPDVEYAEPNAVLSIAGASNDLGAGLWGLDNSGQDRGTADADIDAPEAWGLLGSPWAVAGYTVGVVDTGVDAGHEDLGGKAVTPCYSALGGGGSLTPGCGDDNGHGTHASGTIAATANNGRGIAGVAPGARVLMCKALDSKGAGFLSDIVACMNDIVARRGAHDVKVISLSLGGGGSETLRAAVDNAYGKGVLVVAAAGNSGNSSVSFPAGYENAVSVAASDRQDARASFSSFNSDVEISAPGVAIVSTVPGGYASYSGTSMATPHVAGAAALIAWRQGRSGPALREALAAAVDDLGPAGRDASFGFGRLNLCKALGGGCAYAPSASGSQPGAPTSRADRRPPRVRAGWPSRFDAKSVLGGIRVSCRVNEAAACKLSVEVAGPQARRAGVAKRRRRAASPVTIASGSATLARAGAATVLARPTRAAARALSAGRAFEATLRLTVTDRAGNRTVVTRRAGLGAASRASRSR